MSLFLSVLGSSLVGTVVGAALKTIWDRRAAKKVPKTQMRADAYRDFIVYAVSHGDQVAGTANAVLTTEAEYRNVAARLLLFGESEVVKAVSRLTEHRSLATPAAMADFSMTVGAMRKSLLTGHDDWVLEHASALARSRPWA